MAKHVCAPELGTPCVWFIQHWREQQGGERGGGVLVTSTTRSFSIPASHHKHTWNMAHSDFKQKEKTKKESGGEIKPAPNCG